VTLISAAGLAPLCYWAANQYRPMLGPYALSTTPWGTTMLVVGSYLFSGLWLSNDLDIYSRIYRRWGPLRFLWYPYQRLIAHRSWVSHGLVVGPLLRVVYLYVMSHLVLIGVYHGMRGLGRSTAVVDSGLQVLANVWPYALMHPHISVPLLIGLVLGGVAHSLVDWA
jgi:uncharacterized metal-binding protein